MMRKIICFISLSVTLAALFAQGITLEETRKLYAKSAGDAQKCRSLYERLSASDKKDNAVLTGYFGAVSATMANYLKDPSAKLKYFKDGRNNLEKAVRMDSLNPEIRFLRFTIQTNVPKTLHYDKEIESDKNFLITQLDNCKETEVCHNIATKLISSGKLNDEEKNKVKSIMRLE
jgi:hypothetical protein